MLTGQAGNGQMGMPMGALGQAGRRSGRWLLIALSCAAVLAGCSGAPPPRRPGTIKGRLVAEYSGGAQGPGSIVLNLPVPGQVGILSRGRIAFTASAGPSGEF